MSKTFRQRPIQVTAVQWFPGTYVPGVERWPGKSKQALMVLPNRDEVVVSEGDWIVDWGNGVRGVVTRREMAFRFEEIE